MPDRPHRSRQGWRDMAAEPDDDLVPGMPFHFHRPPRWIVRAILAMALTVGLMLAGLGVAAFYIYQQQQYVQGRGEYRDQETQRLEAQIRTGICDLLDTLPVTPLLDEARRKYMCGPGIPVEQLPPEAQELLDGTPAPIVAAPLSAEEQAREDQRPPPPTRGAP